MSDYWLELLALVIFVGAAAFFAASEAAIVSVSRISARTFAEKGVPGGARLEKMLEDRNRTLTSILIANTFVLLATDSIATYVRPTRRAASAGLVDDRHDHHLAALR